jgi:hypothetical protein
VLEELNCSPVAPTHQLHLMEGIRIYEPPEAEDIDFVRPDRADRIERQR